MTEPMPSAASQSILARASLSSAYSITPLQSQVDGLVGGFAAQATDWRALASMAAGGMAYRAGRIGILGLGSGSGLRAASVGLGLTAEVMTFEGAHRGLTALSGDAHAHANLFRWSGQGGIRQGLLNSFVTFGALKGAGHLAQGQNLVLRHLLMDTGMVAGHQATGLLGIAPTPTGSLAEQFLHAEATTLQLGAGMSLAHRLAPGAHALERGLDLSLSFRSLSSPPVSDRRPIGMREAFATASEGGAAPAETETLRPESKAPPILIMNSSEGGGDKGPLPSFLNTPPRRPTPNSPASVGRPPFSTIPPPTGPRTLTGIFDSEAPLPPFPAEAPVSPPRSVEEGIDRARILGQGPRALEYLRWGMQETRYLPETRRQFLDLMLRFFEFQRKVRSPNEAGEPSPLQRVLAALPEADFKVQNERALHLIQTLEALIPGSRRLAEAAVFSDATKDLRSRADYDALSESALDQRLREAGVEPDSIPSIARNINTLERAEILSILDRPALRELAETADLRRAVEEHLPKGNGNLSQAFEAYVADPIRARILRIEISRFALNTRGLQELSEEQLSSWVEIHRREFSPETDQAWKNLKAAARDLNFLEERGTLTQMFERALEAVGRIPPNPYRVKGRYESAYFEFLGRLSAEQKEGLLHHALSSLELPSESLNELRVLTSLVLEGDRRIAAALREAHRGLEPVNDAMWKEFDDAYFGVGRQPGFLEADLQLQIQQVREQLGRVIQKTGARDFVNRPYVQEFLKNTNAPPLPPEAAQSQAVLLDALVGPAESSVRDMGKVVRRRTVSILMNVALTDRGLQAVSPLRRLTRAALAQEKIPDAAFTVISPFMGPVSEKYDANGWNSLDETLLSSLPHLKNTFILARRAIRGAQQGESPHLRDRLFLQHAAFLTKGTESGYVVNPEVDGIVEREPVVVDASHSSWQGDFLDGTIPGARAAQLNGRHTAQDALRILAKADLGNKMRNSRILGSLAPAIELLTEPVGSTPEDYERAVVQASRSMALGHIPGNRPGPRSAGVFSELCMPVYSMFTPFVFDPFPPSSGMMVPPKGGRGFVIADRAMALTGRPPYLLLANALGGYIMDPPKPNRLYPRRSVPLRTVTELMPIWGLIDPQKNPDSNGGAATSQANLLRTYWWRQAITPEYAPRVESLDERFQPFDKPADITSERTLESMFGGALGVYPSYEATESARRRVNELAAAPVVPAMPAAERARDLYETRLLEVRLQRARLELDQARQVGVDARDMLELSRSLNRKEKRLESIAKKLATGQDLSQRERLYWQVLRTGVGANPVDAEANTITEGLNRLIHDVGASRLPGREAVLNLLNQRLGQARLAFVRQTLGERISPAEEVLLEDLKSALVPGLQGPGNPDRLLVLLQRPFAELNSTEILNLLAEERVREYTRQLSQRLPGSGRGALDSMDEISQTGAAEGSSFDLRAPSLDLPARIAARGLSYGLGETLLDWLGGTENGKGLYERSTSGIARSALLPTRWRPVLDAESLRAIEEARLDALRQQVPLTVVTRPLNGMERAALFTLLPEARNSRVETTDSASAPLSGVLLDVSLAWTDSRQGRRRAAFTAARRY